MTSHCVHRRCTTLLVAVVSGMECAENIAFDILWFENAPTRMFEYAFNRRGDKRTKKFLETSVGVACIDLKDWDASQNGY